METIVLAALMLMDPLQSGTVRSTVPSPATIRLEQRLCRGRLKAVAISPYGGMSIKFMLRFVGGGKAVFKPSQTLYSARYSAELAAYRLANHFGSSQVPPACERTLSWDTLLRAADGPAQGPLRQRMAKELKVDANKDVVGAAIHWVRRVQEVRLESTTSWRKWLIPGALVPKEHRQRARDIADLLLLDLLFSNPDRFTGGNTLMALPSRRLLMIDNGASFRRVPHLDRPYHRQNLALMGRVRRATYQRLLRFDEEQLERIVRRPVGRKGHYLSRQERKALLKRRLLIIAHVERLIKAHGDAAVYLP